MSAPEVYSLIRGDLDLVEEDLAGLLRSDLGIVDAVGRYLSGAGGKRIRPALLLLAARLCGGAEGAAPTVRMAAVMEMLHAATLVHESRHGDGYHHNENFCDDGYDCDPTLGSCYGTEAIYRLMLIKGSYGLMAGDKPAMTNWDVFTLGFSSCSSMLANLEPGRLPPELAAYLATEQCSFSTRDILESLGLENAFD